MIEILKATKQVLSEKIQTENSFDPNLTTGMIYYFADQEIKRLLDRKSNLKVLELGCGSGIISLMLKKKYGSQLEMHLSDIVELSVEDARKNFEINNLSAKIKKSNMFEAWDLNTPYDLILYDVTGISGEIAKLSPWFDKAYASDCVTGVTHLINFISTVKKLKNKQKSIIFPLLSLSNHNIVRKHINDLNILNSGKVHWPVPIEDFKVDFKSIANNENHTTEIIDGIYNAWTEVYVCSV